jgi:hypothetical protein
MVNLQKRRLIGESPEFPGGGHKKTTPGTNTLQPVRTFVVYISVG